MSCNGTYAEESNTAECNDLPPLSFLIWLFLVAILAAAFILAMIVRRGTVAIWRRRRPSAEASETSSSVYIVSSSSLQEPSWTPTGTQDASALNAGHPPAASQPPPSYEELQMEELPPHYDVAYSKDIR